MKNIFIVMLSLLAGVGVSFGQAISVNGGAIQGSITDPTGASIPGATVVIASSETGYTKALQTDSAGFYSVGPLNPGPYTVRISSPGFEALAVNTVIRIGTVSSGTFRLTLGKSSETIEVNASAIQVNTDQISVSDVLTHDQLNALPINGRNFLDVAQIEPGVILQSGNTFDPTKAGYSAISVSGVSGRTTRILLDGQDITDEFVGTTIFNVSQGSISEFQLNRSTQDVSGDVTSTGQVLVSTTSGTDSLHGQGFYIFQDARALFANQTNNGALTANPPFQRNQYGGSVGGRIIRDKLFFFANAERIQQAQAASAGLGPLFAGTSFGQRFSTFGTPYKETYEVGRLDYNGPFGGHYFVRGVYNFNGSVSNFGNNYQLYKNRDNTYGISGGADFANARFTHSVRGSYEKFHNFIADDTIGNSGIYNPIPSLTFRYSAQHLFAGPNVDAPQGTFQSDKQLRYDGTYTRGSHIFKFGGSVNRLQSAAFAAFFGLAPRATESVSTGLLGTVTTQNPLGLGCNGVAGGPSCLSDPLNGYNVSSLAIGNNLGFSTEVPAFGLPGGGGAAWRGAAYVADSFKVTANLTVSAGVRWSVDTNRENNDLAPPTCASLSTPALAAFAATPGTNPCAGKDPTTSLFALYNPSFTGSVRQPYGDFAPQIGLNYSPGDHKTSFRAGFGLFFESEVFNNTANARSNLLPSGAFFGEQAGACSAGSVSFPDGRSITSINSAGQVSTAATPPPGYMSLKSVCRNNTLAQAAPLFVLLQQAYQANAAANAISVNGGYIGATLNATDLFAPNFKTPYSEQWNFGVQREVFKGAVLSVDYVHNTTLKIGQTLDVNHEGAARNFNKANATLAVQTTLAACAPGATVATAIVAGGCPGLHGAGSGATISDFASNGLDSQAIYVGATSYAIAGKPNAGAFPGNNPLLGAGAFVQPVGRSGYDALQIVYRQQKAHPFRYTDSANVQISYSRSRIVSTGTAGGGTAGSSDEFFNNAVADNDNPSLFMGRSSLDRSNELSFGGSITLKHSPRISAIGHFYSALPGTLALDTQLTNGGIFQTDVTGDGTTGDPAPGTNLGDYMHRVNGGNLQAFINNFNATQAGRLTPAGQQVVNSGLFTQAQLVAIGGAIQPVANLPQTTGLNNPAFRSMDVSVSYPIRFAFLREGVSLEPSISFYNVGNFSNFASYTTTLTNVNSAGGPVNNSSSSVTGLNNFATQAAGRALRGSGTFDQGAARSAEFGLKLNF
jgi:Carboxypeptidase regulatory-like domain